MLIFTKIKELQAFLTQIRLKKQTVGFVPTMGALHMGHISLINASKQACNVTICSIFVNPTQFNDKNDLERYPRTPESDIELLISFGCTALFMPSAEEMYPQKDETTFDFGYLDKVLEGAHRPGHFNGVAMVVNKFFGLIKPDKAFFGGKDYQQAMIIKALNVKQKYNIDVVVCPTLRDEDGLAMSSRNTLLGKKEREVAKIIPKLMNEVVPLKEKGFSITEIKQHVTIELAKKGDCKLDYFTICDADTLKEINSFAEAKHHVALIACYVGKIRLIDNLAF